MNMMTTKRETVATLADFWLGFVTVWMSSASEVMLFILIQIYYLLHKTAFDSKEECFIRNVFPQREYWQQVNDFFKNASEKKVKSLQFTQKYIGIS